MLKRQYQYTLCITVSAIHKQSVTKLTPCHGALVICSTKVLKRNPRRRIGEEESSTRQLSEGDTV